MSSLNISLSGLLASKAAMDATAQNVANVNTEGYSRQEVRMSAVDEGAPSRSRAGTGVQISGVRRYSNMFTNTQLWLSDSRKSYAQSMSDGYRNIEDLVSQSSQSIATSMDDFFSGLYDASLEPQSTALRQQVISRAEATALQFNTLTSSLEAQSVALKNQFVGGIEELNSYLGSVSELNIQIERLIGTGANPSALQDQRDTAIRAVSNLIEVRTEEQPAGAINLSLASGEPVVVGGSASEFRVELNSATPNELPVILKFANTDFTLDSALGGTLGAINEFNSSHMGIYRDTLNEMANYLATSVNAQLAEGQDLNGNTGTAIKALYQIGDATNPALTISVNDINVRDLAFSSIADDGDPMTIDPTTPGNGDNLLALIDLRSKAFSFSDGGAQTLNSAYTSTVSNIAILAKQARADLEANNLLNEQAIATRDSISGVNSDEEAAKLMQYANAYQANMKVITVMDQLFEDLLRSI